MSAQKDFTHKENKLAAWTKWGRTQIPMREMASRPICIASNCLEGTALLCAALSLFQRLLIVLQLLSCLAVTSWYGWASSKLWYRPNCALRKREILQLHVAVGRCERLRDVLSIWGPYFADTSIFQMLFFQESIPFPAFATSALDSYSFCVRHSHLTPCFIISERMKLLRDVIRRSNDDNEASLRFLGKIEVI